MDINQIKQQFRGRKFGELILHHRRRSNSQITIKALYGYIRELPKGSQELTESQQPVYLESWIDEMNQNVHLEWFWQQDCGDALAAITSAAETKLIDAGIKPTADDLFNMFQVAVLHFVNSTYGFPQTKIFIQKSVGIRSLMRWLTSDQIRLTTALVITSIFSVWGTIAEYSHLWIPYSGVVASIIDLFTRKWVASEKTGEWVNLSVLLKFALSLVGFYAMLIQFACVALGIYWIMIK